MRIYSFLEKTQMTLISLKKPIPYIAKKICCCRNKELLPP